MIIANYISVEGIESVCLKQEQLDEGALKENEVLIKTDVSYISPGTELSRVYGLKKNATYPWRPGYCSVGRVMKIGSGVKKASVNDRVFFDNPHADYAICDENNSMLFFKVDEALSDVEGSFLMMAWIAMNGIWPANVKLGDTVGIFGLGTLGLISTILYKQMGVKVIAIDPVSSRCMKAKAFCVDDIIHCQPNEQVAEIMKRTKNKGVDIAIDAAGVSASIENAILSTTDYGQVLLLGSPRVEYNCDVTPIFNHIHMKQIEVIGCLNQKYMLEKQKGTRLNMLRGIDYLSELMKKKVLNVDAFISHVIAPNEALDAYKGLMHKKEEYTGVVIDWGKLK